MELLVRFANALADETRWRIIQLIREQALCVCELADILKMPQSSVSSHLQVIRKADLLESERCEKWIYYRVGRKWLPLLETIRDQFEFSSRSNSLLVHDARSAVKRLAKREQTCCPGPKVLAFKSRHRAALVS